MKDFERETMMQMRLFRLLNALGIRRGSEPAFYWIPSRWSTSGGAETILWP